MGVPHMTTGSSFYLLLQNLEENLCRCSGYTP